MLNSASLMAQMGASPGGTGLIPPTTSPNSTSSVTVLTVAGRVINAVTGQPVPRALVQLNGDRSVLADHEGKFEIPQFSAGNPSYTVTVTKPGFYATSEPFGQGLRRVRADELSSNLELRMYPEALITGTVTGPDGQPMPHINVMANRSVYGAGRIPEHTWMMSGQSLTNEHGSFRIVVPPGDYRLQTGFNRNPAGQTILPLNVPGNSATSKSDTFHLAAGSEEHFDLRPVVGRTYLVSIAVDSSGEGRLPMIVARSGDGTTIPLGGMRPSGPGEMKAELPSGTYTLEATLRLPAAGTNGPETVFYGETGVTVTDHDLTGVSLHMAAVPFIPVVVDVDSAATSDKTPPTIPQLGLALEGVDSLQGMFGQNMVVASSSSDGTFRFSPSPGSYKLMANGGTGGGWYVKAASYGTEDLLTQDLTVVAGADGGLIRVTVSDQTGAVRGVARLHGEPAESNVYFVPTRASSRTVYTTRSGSDGTYNIASLPPGTYRAVAFEQQHSMDFRDPHALDAFSTHVQAVTVAVGDKEMIDLDAVAESEVVP